MTLLKIGMAATLLCATIGVADPPAAIPLVTMKPVKVSAADAAGPVFTGKTAVTDKGSDGVTIDVLLHRSKDGNVEMGLYAAGPSDVDIASYEDDEFMYFIAGGVTLTSADGTVLPVQAGEGVAIPKGWKGRWSTQGYKKYYVIYTGGAKPM